jgi:protein-export membrane protein SecD
MDDQMISAPTVNTAITNGQAYIDGMANIEEASDLANKINAGSLPFALTADDSKLQIISPSLGSNALQVMIIAGACAFLAICIIMILRYKVPGFVASLCLMGQVAAMIACVSGYFPGIQSFTLTIPGIAGIILSIGMGVDANVIINERIKEELHIGKTIDGALYTGFKRAFAAIFDGNITMLIIAVILMGAFGTPDSICSIILTPIFTWFGVSTAGSIYSFGYTLAVGVVLNFVFGIFTTRLMTMSLSRFRVFRKPVLYGGKKAERSGN